jgi:hypothetical protein
MTTQPVGNERPRGRLARLFEAADRRHVPLRTILVTAGVVVAAYLAGKLMYRLRDIVVLMLVAGFVAALLAIPTAGMLQVLVKEVWQATAPDRPQESPAPAAEPADEYGHPAGQHRPHPAAQASDLN